MRTPLPRNLAVTTQSYVAAEVTRRKLRWIESSLLAAAFALSAALAGAADAPAGESPFLPDGYGSAPAPAAPPSALDRYQFSSVVRYPDETVITLVDTSTSKSITLAVGETVEGIHITGYVSEEGTLQIEAGGQVKTLKLNEAKIVAMAAPPPQPMAPQNGPLAQNPPSVPPPVAVGAPMSDEEARQRMQRVAEEIRRRREMRRQMLEKQEQARPAR